MTNLGFRGLWEFFAKPSHNVPQAMEGKLVQVVAILHFVLRRRVDALVQENLDEPMCESYQSDSTPMSLMDRIRMSALGVALRRAGRYGASLLIERKYWKTAVGEAGSPSKTVVDSRPPLLLDRGKGGWSHYEAWRSFGQNGREKGHRGILIEHFAWDRAQWLWLMSHIMAFFTMCCKDFADADGCWFLLYVMTWVVGTACCLHDTNNALRWACNTWYRDKPLLRAIFVVFSSLRHAFDLIVFHLPPWLDTVLTLSDEDRYDDYYALFGSCGFTGADLELLAQLQPRFSSGKLFINKKFAAAQEDLLNTVTTAMHLISKFKVATESRWKSVTEAMAVLAIGSLVGLSPFVAFILENETKKYYLKGYRKVNEDMLRFAALSVLGCAIGERFLEALLQDGRVAMRRVELEELLMREVERAAGHAWFTYTALAGVAKMSVWFFKSEVIRIAWIVAAFVDYRVLSEARKLPWRLCQGDIASNLTAFAAGECPSHPEVAYKIWKCLELLPFAYVLRAVALLAQIDWHTLGSEQGHASAALMKRFHDTYGAFMVRLRAFLHHLRPLLRSLPETTSLTRLIRKLDDKLRSVEMRCPKRSRIETLYVRETHAGLRQGGRASASFEASQHVLQAVHQRVQGMSLEEKRRLEARKRARIQELETNNATDRKNLLDEREEAMKGLRELEEKDRDAMKLSSARFSQEEVDSMDALLASPDFARHRCDINRVCPPHGPKKPPALVREAIERQMTNDCADASDDEPVPLPWLGKICWNRDSMPNTTFVFPSRNGSPEVAYTFLFALQRPYVVGFLKLNPLPKPAPPRNLHEVRFKHEWRPVTVFGQRHDALPIFPVQEVKIVQNCFFISKDLLVSDQDAESFETFLSSLPIESKPVQRKVKKEADTESESDSDGLAKSVEEKFDLHRHLHRAELDGASSEEEEEDDAGEDEPEPAEEETLLESVMKVFEELAAKKEELAEERHADVPKVFSVSVSAGKKFFFCSGRATYQYIGSTNNQSAKMWLTSYGMKMSWSLDAQKYTVPVAALLAKEWCRKMNHFYDIFATQGTFALQEVCSQGWLTYEPSAAFAELCERCDLTSAAEHRIEELNAMFPKPSAVLV